MGFYSHYIVPQLIRSSCTSSRFKPMRNKLIPQADGRVLEIGIGAGSNLSYYRNDRVSHVWGLEPSEQLRKMAAETSAKTNFPVELIAAKAEKIPLENASVDTIVSTFTLCTIDNPVAAFSEMQRVLRPGGKLLFCEHGRSPEEHVFRWQDRINPAWKIFGGGCNINRPTIALLEENGWRIEGQESDYMDKFKLVSYISLGSATKRA